MVKRLPIFLLVLSTRLALGQLDSNSITVTATRSMAQQPDQVLFGVTVQSGLSTGLDDVVAALQGSPITAANFAGVGSVGLQIVNNPFPGPATPSLVPTLQWTFALSVPLAKMKDTIATLSTLQKSIAQQNRALTLSFSVQGAQVSTQLQQSQACPTADLLADARAQAQKLANAAGLSLGVVLAMSTGVSVPGGTPTSLSISGFLLGTPAVFPSNCSMTVRFALLRY